MTLPEELVTAAAEAICAARTIECRRLGCCKFYEDHARLAVAAVLRALPECEAVMDIGRRAAVNPWSHDASYERSTAWRGFIDGVAAIAKLADDA